MITKKLWTELVTSNNFANVITNDTITVAGQIDTLMHDKFNITTSLATFITYIKTAFLTNPENTNQWGGLNIHLSSYSIGDERFVYLLNDKIRKYLAFYYKFTYDDGLAKNIVTDRWYTDTPRVTTTDESIHSELPQIELNNFEEGIKYASSMDKNTNSFTGDNRGTAYERKSETTWDENMSNLRTILFNDLIDYIARVPNMLYNHYSLDTMPFVERIKATCEYLKNLSDAYSL